MFVVLAVAFAYHNSFSVPFLFDDIVSIVENPAVRKFSLTSVLGLEQASGLTTSGRPILALSLALNHTVSGDAVWSYHVVNVAIHALAGLLLMGVVRRTLLMPAMQPRYGAVALPLAALVALVWALHPLQTG